MTWSRIVAAMLESELRIHLNFQFLVIEYYVNNNILTNRDGNDAINYSDNLISFLSIPAKFKPDSGPRNIIVLAE